MKEETKEKLILGIILSIILTGGYIMSNVLLGCDCVIEKYTTLCIYNNDVYSTTTEEMGAFDCRTIITD